MARPAGYCQSQRRVVQSESAADGQRRWKAAPPATDINSSISDIRGSSGWQSGFLYHGVSAMQQHRQQINRCKIIPAKVEISEVINAPTRPATRRTESYDHSPTKLPSHLSQARISYPCHRKKNSDSDQRQPFHLAPGAAPPIRSRDKTSGIDLWIFAHLEDVLFVTAGQKS